MRKIWTLAVVGLIITTTLLIGFYSCKCSHQESKVANDIATNASKDSFPYPGIIFLLPSPTEVLLTTINNDIAFNPKLIAPNDIEKKAIISHQQALILGVYLTDLSYNIIFKNHQAGIDNINSIKGLTEKLGIGSFFYERFLHRIETNINSIDSMNVIFEDFSQNSFETLETTGNSELLSLVAMGSGIEAMFLSYKSISIDNINNIILPNFLGQKIIYENYYKNFLNYNYNKPELKYFLNDLNCIYSLFKKNVAVKEHVTISDVKNSHFSIKDRQDTSPYNINGIRELGDSIVILRNNLINLKYQ